MNVVLISDFFFWCMIINLGLLLWWAGFIMLAHDWVYRMHTRWFKLSVEAFDRVHYAGMALFKIAIFVFNIAPWIALKIMA